MRILLVEDDPLLGDGLARGLELAGWTVDWVRRASDAETAERTTAFDAVVLDLGLPDGDGQQLLARWRGRDSALPVVILTARDALESRIDGLDAGADDYLVKPVAVEELSARLRAVLRRASGRSQGVWQHGDLSFDPASREVTWRGRRVELTARETAVLDLLLSNPTRVLPKALIQEKLYDWRQDSDSNTVEVFVHHLRRKIDPSVVRTVRGLGYALGKATTQSQET